MSFTTEKSPHEVFQAINAVTKWWTENLDGKTQKQGDEFSVRFGDVHYSKHQITEMVPDKKIVWLTKENRLNFVKNVEEWKGMTIVFDIAPEGSGSKVTFT